MATKNTPTPPAKRPTQVPSTSRDSVVRKSNDQGRRILGENQGQTTVFQTRPTPPDPNKK